jgi:hypothetical protein
MVASRARAIDLDAIGQARLLQQVTHDAFTDRRAADVTQTDEAEAQHSRGRIAQMRIEWSSQ